MMKKLLNTFAFLVILGILVAGGVIRTQAVTGSEPSLTDTLEQAVPGTVETTVSDWESQMGTVQSWEDQILTVLMDTGESVLVEGRGGRYLSEKDFTAVPGERVTLTGFYEGDDFEVAIITNKTTGVTIRLRGEDGRPVWGSGGGGQ